MGQTKIQKLSVDSKLRFAIQICEAMNELHKAKMVHGHLHMQNILVSDDYTIVISDLGFRSVKKLKSLQGNYRNIGYYTAPENLDKL